MKTKKEKSQESDEAAAVQNKEIAPAAKAASEDFSSELNEPRWSVVSFEKLEAKNLTYDEAVRKLKKFSAKKNPGCAS